MILNTTKLEFKSGKVKKKLNNKVNILQEIKLYPI